ncbi:MAG: S9 family peptidase [Bacteroidetes bacterium]|nr:S9 family peptidase [Bacteroidota bacterium]
MRRLLVLMLLIFNSNFYAQQQYEKELNTVFGVQYLGNAKFSNTGEKLVYTISKPDFESNIFQSTLLVKDINSELPASKISLSEWNYSSISFSTDNRKIFYIANQNRNGNQVYSRLLSGGRSTQITTFPNSVQRYSLSADGAKILFLAEDTLTISERKTINEKKDGYYYEENRKFNSVYEFELLTKKRTKLTFGFNIKSFAVSKNGKYLALLGTTSAIPGDEHSTEIYLLDLSTKAVKRLTRNSAIEKQIAWGMNDDSILFVAAANENLEPYYQESIFSIGLIGDSPVDLLPNFQYQVIKFEFESKSKKIFFIANKGLTQQLFQYDLESSQVTELTSVMGVVKDFALNPVSSKILIQYTDPSAPDEFYLSDNSRNNFKKVIDANPSFDKSNLAKYQPLEWFSNDGAKIQGNLILPKNIDKKKQYPVVIQLHGGPNSSYQLSFGSFWASFPHYLVSQGYLVFQPNYRGSTGYGDKFMRGIIEDFFELGTEDILSGVDFLVNTGIADNSKLFLMGYSAGAHFTNWIISQDQNFKAAISIAGMANWISFYSQTEVPYLREIWLNSIPYENMDFWNELSPVYHAEEIKTPTLFICGELDKRVPLNQSIEMYRALKRMNVPTKLLIFPREYHSIEELKHQYQLIKASADWLNKYVN